MIIFTKPIDYNLYILIREMLVIQLYITEQLNYPDVKTIVYWHHQDFKMLKIK